MLMVSGFLCVKHECAVTAQYYRQGAAHPHATGTHVRPCCSEQHARPTPTPILHIEISIHFSTFDCNESR